MIFKLITIFVLCCNFGLCGIKSPFDPMGKLGRNDVLDGIIGWWKLDGNTSDSVGTNDAVAVKVTPADGLIGQCYEWSNRGYITSSSCGCFIGTNAFSFSAWFYSGSPPSGFGTVFGIGASQKSYYWIFISGSGLLGIADGYGGNGVSSGVNVCDGVWHHIVFVEEVTTRRLYIDGVSTLEYPYARDMGTPYYVLGNTSLHDYSYQAGSKIDDVRFYDRALTGNEVITIYNRFWR